MSQGRSEVEQEASSRQKTGADAQQTIAGSKEEDQVNLLIETTFKYKRQSFKATWEVGKGIDGADLAIRTMSRMGHWLSWLVCRVKPDGTIEDLSTWSDDFEGEEKAIVAIAMKRYRTTGERRSKVLRTYTASVLECCHKGRCATCEKVRARLKAKVKRCEASDD